MGKASKWFRALLGSNSKRLSSGPSVSSSPPAGLDSRPIDDSNIIIKRGVSRSVNDDKRKCRNATTEPSSSDPSYVEGTDANNHSIAVAAATAAVAEAALAAAKAAAEVVRLTNANGGNRVAALALNGNGGDRRRLLAAVKIQSAFRAYLARRALRALKGLVKLQALVRGHIVRKQSADMLRRMQAMARIQARVCANRAFISESSYSNGDSSQFNHAGLAYITKLDGSILKRCDTKSSIKNNVNTEIRPLDYNWLNHWTEESLWKSRNGCANDEKNDKILEVDTWKPLLKPSQRDETFQTRPNDYCWNYNERGSAAYDQISRHLTKSQHPNASLPFAASSRSVKYPFEEEQGVGWTGGESPRIHSSRSGSVGRRGHFSPARSVFARSLFRDYLSHPNFMADTESSRARFRSQSAPKQRVQLEKASPSKLSAHGYWNEDINSEKGSTTSQVNRRS